MSVSFRMVSLLIFSALLSGGLLGSAAAERAESSSVIEKHFRNLNLLTLDQNLRVERVLPFLAARRENIQLDFRNCYLAFACETGLEPGFPEEGDGFELPLEGSRAFIAADGNFVSSAGGHRVSSFMPDMAQLYFHNSATDPLEEGSASDGTDPGFSLLAELTDTRLEMVAPLTPETLPSAPGEAPVRYIVKQGENLATVAKKLNVPYQELKKLNAGRSPFGDQGRVIRVPGTSSAVRTSAAIQGGTRGTPSRSARSGFVWPVQAVRISSRYGYRIHPISRRRKFHNGIDLAATYGRKIVAATTGIVEFAGWKSYYGKTVIIRHANGLKTLYAHCSRIDVRQGQKVSSGQGIAAIGQSGLATGPHLHYSVIKNGKFIDPIQYLR